MSSLFVRLLGALPAPEHLKAPDGVLISDTRDIQDVGDSLLALGLVLTQELLHLDGRENMSGAFLVGCQEFIVVLNQVRGRVYGVELGLQHLKNLRFNVGCCFKQLSKGHGLLVHSG